MLHLDVKPANELVTSKGICKLRDFGCSMSIAKSGTRSAPRLSWWAPLDIKHQSCCLKTLLRLLVMSSLGILLWPLDSREVPYAGQHAWVYLYFFVDLLDKFNVTFSDCHVERGCCQYPPHHPPS